MKILKLLTLLALPVLAMGQTKTELSSKIEQVTVYYDGAQVTRTAKTTLQSGTTELVFKGITKFADVQNLQVKGDGDFTILKIVPIPNFLSEKKSKTETEELNKRIKEIDDKIRDITVDKNVLSTERSLITSNQQMKGTDAVLTAQQLRDMADFFRTRITEIDAKTLDIDRQVAKLSEERNRNVMQLNALANYKDDMNYDITVTVSAKTTTNAALYLRYNTTKAGWYASYDVNVKNVAEPLALNLRANVSQTSGEDWTNVKLTLSTGSPSISNNKPELTPWYLNFGYPTYTKPVYNANPNPTLTGAYGRVVDRATGEPIPFATVSIKGTGVGTATDVNGYFSLALPQNSDMLIIKTIGFKQVEMWPTANMYVAMESEAKNLGVVVVSESRYTKSADYAVSSIDVIKPNIIENKSKSRADKANYAYTAGNNATTNVVAQPTNYIFEIKEPYTIASNGKANTVGIKDYSINANYEYYCAPKLDKDAFLTANLTDIFNLELIDGEANVYFENTYVGKTLLDMTNTKDTLSISLGRDKNVVVDLVKTKEFTQRQVLGSNQIDKRAWDITVKNKKKQEIKLVLEDRFPIPTNNEISVDNTDVSGADFNKETGILTWRITLGANAERKVSPKYAVKYPKGQSIYLE